MIHDRRGFSLIELVIVMAVSLILTGMLLPALSQVRENVNRVVSASNMRQLGMVMMMYTRSSNEEFPYTRLLSHEPDDTEPWKLMSANLGSSSGGWDGLGLLFIEGYVGDPQVYYCPGYLGEHTFSRYAQAWHPAGEMKIVTNYHYCGHLDWEKLVPRRLGDQRNPDQILFSDALYQEGPLNHENGINVMREDGSVRWLDGEQELNSILGTVNANDPESYREIWGRLEKISK